MKLLVVYGLKTRDKAWLAGFYPARRLSEACANRSIPLRFLFPHEISDSPPGAFPIADFPPADTVCLLRGTIPDGTWRALESAGYRCVNSRESTALALDKLETARFLERHGWPTPLTVPYPAEAAEAGCDSGTNPLDPVSFPFVLKPRFGSRGEGVELIENKAAHEAWKASHNGGNWIAQEFIEASCGRDLRFFFTGGEVIAAVERHGAPGDIRSNASTGGIMRAAENGEGMNKWRLMTLDIARGAGLWYGTVDYLYQTESELAVCEINGSPGFEALERDLGIDVASMLVERLVRDFG